MFEIPGDLLYLDSHEWYRESDGRVGITDFAQDELGDVVFVELPGEGDELVAGESFGVVESIKAVSDVYAPVSGTVVSVNEALADSPEALNDDPYGEGWLLEVEPADGADGADREELLSADEYAAQVE